MTKTYVAAILVGIISALIAVIAGYIVLGLFLGQLLEDVRPSLVPLVNVGAVALLLAVSIITFRCVFGTIRGCGDQRERAPADKPGNRG